jgi:hypothetical protein
MWRNMLQSSHLNIYFYSFHILHNWSYFFKFSTLDSTYLQNRRYPDFFFFFLTDRRATIRIELHVKVYAFSAGGSAVISHFLTQFAQMSSIKKFSKHLSTNLDHLFTNLRNILNRPDQLRKFKMLKCLSFRRNHSYFNSIFSLVLYHIGCLGGVSIPTVIVFCNV